MRSGRQNHQVIWLFGKRCEVGIADFAANFGATGIHREKTPAKPIPIQISPHASRPTSGSVTGADEHNIVGRDERTHSLSGGGKVQDVSSRCSCAALLSRAGRNIHSPVAGRKGRWQKSTLRGKRVTRSVLRARSPCAQMRATRREEIDVAKGGKAVRPA
jgi:hypothetical protein